MLRYMLDTNICIYTIKNNLAAVREKFRQHQNHICISSIVLSELLYGADKSSQPEKSLALIEGMAARLEGLSFDKHTAAHVAEIRAYLAQKGTSIGHYDVLIARHARSRGVVLVSNLHEFERGTVCGWRTGQFEEVVTGRYSGVGTGLARKLTFSDGLRMFQWQIEELPEQTLKPAGDLF